MAGPGLASSGHCRKCGYDLRASAGRCPECGRQFDPANPRTFSRRPPSMRWRWLKRGLIALALLLFVTAPPIAWLYRDWKVDHDAIVESQMPSGCALRKIGPPFLSRWAGERFGYLLERADSFYVDSADDWGRLGRLHHVRRLIIAAPLDHGLDSLLGMPELEMLHIERQTIRESSFKSLGQLKKLAFLNLSRCTLDGPCLRHLATLPLKELDLSDARVAQWEGLEDLLSVTVLNLDDCPIGDEDFVRIAKLKNLKELSLRSNKQITDLAIVCLRNLPIEVLNLDYTHVTDGVFPFIENLQQLRQLHLNRTLVTDPSRCDWTVFPNLEFSVCSYTAGAFERLQRKWGSRFDIYGYEPGSGDPRLSLQRKTAGANAATAPSENP